MTIPSSHIYKLCERKRKYSSKKNAINFLNGLKKKGILVSPLAEVYKCPFAEHWHTGHKK